MNPLTVRIFDCNGGQVCTQFLDMCMSSVMGCPCHLLKGTVANSYCFFLM